MKVLSVAQMKSVERNAVNLGVSYIELMENAGTGCAEKIVRKYFVINKSVVILCGNGNNGGDGLVIARKLHEKGANVTVILCQSFPATKESSHMYQMLEHLDVDILDSESDYSLSMFKIKQADYLIDTVFGTGFHGALEGRTKQLIERANHSFGKRISVDIPSGICGDTGASEGSYFNAELTLVLGAYKKAHMLEESADKCGELDLVDIGIPNEAFSGMDLEVTDLSLEMIKKLLPERNPDSHKGDYGKLLNIAGSVGMGGAALMCTKAALRCGAGIVTLATPRSVVQGCFSQIMEAVTLPLRESEKGTIGDKNIDLLEERIKASTACVIGCGLGQGDDISKTVHELVRWSKTPLILDADGINAMASDINIVQTAKCEMVLTPHPGEMARLTGQSIAQIESNRVKTAHDFAKEYQVIVVLKGHETIIATPEGELYRNTTGNAGMAKGGSGDVLSGMIGSFAAQKIPLKDAVLAAVYLHGMAGDRCAEKYSQYGMKAGDIIDEIPLLLRELNR